MPSADFTVSGDDRALAAWVADHPGALLAFRPSATSDLARAVGLRADARGSVPGTTVVTLDALRLGDGDVAVNMVVVGTPPDRTTRFTRRLTVTLAVDGTPVATERATGIVVATGQYLRALDLVPRGHPGDGRLEVQVYRLRPNERRAMRERLPLGTHVPNPRITSRPGHHVELRGEEPFALEVDGEARSPVRALAVDIDPGAYRLLV
jgi:hypothetical protein